MCVRLKKLFDHQKHTNIFKYLKKQKHKVLVHQSYHRPTVLNPNEEPLSNVLPNSGWR